MAEMKKELDSTTYRKLLEFIKKEGAETFISFFDDYTKVKEENLIFRALCEGKHPLLALVRKHKTVAGFIKELDIKYPCFLLDKGLPGLLDSISEENISQQIECARLLEDLGVSAVDLGFKNVRNKYQTIIRYGSDLEIIGLSKYYSNGELDYVLKTNYHGNWIEYATSVNFSSDSGNFLLGAQNVITHEQERHIRLTDFTFDTSLLPSEEELSRMAVPKTLADSKVYVKR